MTKRVIGWAKAFRDDIARLASGGVYLNFVGDEGAPDPRGFRRGEIPSPLEDQGRVRPRQRLLGDLNIEPALAGARR